MHKLTGLKLKMSIFLKNKIPDNYSSTDELSQNVSGSTSLLFVHLYQHNIVESVQHIDSLSQVVQIFIVLFNILLMCNSELEKNALL